MNFETIKLYLITGIHSVLNFNLFINEYEGKYI
jgi:hypothetical protein